MDELKEALRSAEDALLVELSNKGIVKRAYKDLENEKPDIRWGENDAAVTLADAVCTIRLPLAESTCTCPSRSMCRHRIAAILWLKREISGGEQPFSKEELVARREAVPDKKPEEVPKEKPKTEKKIDEAQAETLARLWREQLILQLSTGLTRLSKETEESLERLALLSHRSGFARLEREAREAQTLYGQYFSRAAAFRTENLMKKLLGLYAQAQALSDAGTQDALRTLAGSFRDSYEPVGTLTLSGMGSRAFRSQNGYEGEIYYFLETTQNEWYIWTDARPTFYEGRRRPVGSSERQSAPWELNCNREQLTKLEFRLTNARAARGNRLSVSQETKGEVIGGNILHGSAFSAKTVWDYRILLEQYFSKSLAEQEETDHLALVGAARCGESSFDSVEQRFFLPLYDLAGQKLPISLRYSKEEKYTIHLLERLQKRLSEKTDAAFAFFGRLYLDKETLVLYPIEFFDGVSLPENTNLPKQSVKAEVDAELLHEFSDYLTDVEQTLSDLFQSGLDSVLDETIHRLSRLAADGETLGLHLAGEKLTAMADALQAKRHRTDFAPGPLLDSWTELIQYLNICRELVAQDSAYLAMEPEKEEEIQ